MPALENVLPKQLVATQLTTPASLKASPIVKIIQHAATATATAWTSATTTAAAIGIPAPFVDPNDDATEYDPLMHPTEDEQSLADTQQRVTSPRTSESIAEGTNDDTKYQITPPTKSFIAKGTIDDIRVPGYVNT